MDNSDLESVGTFSSSFLGKCKKFNLEDTKLLARLCQSIIKEGPLSNKTVEDELKKSKEGKEFLQNYSISTLLNKVKYERRLARKK